LNAGAVSIARDQSNALCEAGKGAGISRVVKTTVIGCPVLRIEGVVTSCPH